MRNSSKVLTISALLLIFTASAAAFTTGNYWFDSNVLNVDEVDASQTDYNVTKSKIVDPGPGLFSFQSTGDDGIQPGEEVKFCSTIDTEDTGLGAYVYFELYVWSDYNTDHRFAKDVHIPAGSSQEVCLDVTAADSSGSYNIGMYDGDESANYELVHGETMEVVEDSDGDGYSDDEDNCPDKAGDLNGCPDSDGDGIKDSDDDCPYTEGVQALDGCPNSEPEITSFDVPGSAAVNESFQVTTIASDQDSSQTLEYSYGNGETGETATYSFSTSGEKTVEVTVGDGITEVTESATVEVTGEGKDDKKESPETDDGEDKKSETSIFDRILSWIGVLF